MADRLVVSGPFAASEAGISIRADEAPPSLVSLKVQCGKNGEEEHKEEEEERDGGEEQPERHARKSIVRLLSR